LVTLSSETLKSLGSNIRSIKVKYDDLIVQCIFPNTVKKATKNIFFPEHQCFPEPHAIVCNSLRASLISRKDMPCKVHMLMLESRTPNACSRNLSVSRPNKRLSNQELPISKLILTLSADSSPLDPSPDFLSSCFQAWGVSFLLPDPETSDAGSSILLRSWASTLHTQAHCTD
jgi:hypothetical protein